MRRSLGTAARLGTPATRIAAARIAAACLVGAACLAGGGAGAQQPATWNDRDVAVLQGLDKITARVWTFEARVGDVVRFGTLDLTVEACRVRPPEEPPDSAAFIEVREIPAAPGDAPLFRGWMFASSPALSSLEHAVYDVWVLDCK